MLTNNRVIEDWTSTTAAVEPLSVARRPGRGSHGRSRAKAWRASAVPAGVALSAGASGSQASLLGVWGITAGADEHPGIRDHTRSRPCSPRRPPQALHSISQPWHAVMTIMRNAPEPFLDENSSYSVPAVRSYSVPEVLSNYFSELALALSVRLP